MEIKREHSLKTSCDCGLCRKALFLQTSQSKIKTTSLCVMILKSLKQLKPLKDFYSMKEDIYDYVSDHWVVISQFSIFQKANWKKMLLDTFNHCSFIETGRAYGLRASFRLKDHKIKDDSSSVSVKTFDSSSSSQEVVEISQTLWSSFDSLVKQMNKNALLLESYGHTSHNIDCGFCSYYANSQLVSANGFEMFKGNVFNQN
ncbi:Uncharacterized protein QTN25_003329 [Entamoeba marina]